MLGLVIIIVLGGIIMILAGLLEVLASKAVTWLSRKDSKAAYAILEWKTNTALQLQRLAHEGIGSGTWSQAADMIPVTERGEILGILDISDRQHPRLISPSSHGNEEECSFGHDTETGEAIEMTATAMTSTFSLTGRRVSDHASDERVKNGAESGTFCVKAGHRGHHYTPATVLALPAYLPSSLATPDKGVQLGALVLNLLHEHVEQALNAL